MMRIAVVNLVNIILSVVLVVLLVVGVALFSLWYQDKRTTTFAEVPSLSDEQWTEKCLLKRSMKDILDCADRREKEEQEEQEEQADRQERNAELDYPAELISRLLKQRSKFYKAHFMTEDNIELRNDFSGSSICLSKTEVSPPRIGARLSDGRLRFIAQDSKNRIVQTFKQTICTGTYRKQYLPDTLNYFCKQEYSVRKLFYLDKTNGTDHIAIGEFKFPSCCTCHLNTTASG